MQKIKHNLDWKMKFLKQATYIGYVLAKLSEFNETTTLTSLDSFLQKIT